MSVVLNTVMNQYMTQYRPAPTTSRESHGREEPEEVYNAMLRQNKDAPLCLPLRGNSLHRYMIDLKENARQLYHTIASLGGTDPSGLLSAKSACSSHPDLVGVKSRSASSGSGSLTLRVDQLASTQENLGLFLSNETIDLPPDTYSFDIGLGDMNYEFQFEIHQDDTVKELQGRLVRLINQADIGLRASLEEDKSMKGSVSMTRTAIKLASSSYGLRSSHPLQFTVSDTGTGMASGVVDYLGLNYVSHYPTNARLFADGMGAIEKSSNEFDLGQFHLKLFSATPPDETVTIGYKDDLESFLDNAAALAEGYNSFLKGTTLYSDLYPRSLRLTRETEYITSLYKEDLESMGMYIQEDGTLRLDASALLTSDGAEASVPDYARSLREFSKLLLAKAYQVSLNPMDYTDKRVVAYKNSGHTFVSPYMVSPYSGMMFSGYC